MVWLVIGGVVLLLIAGVLESYCRVSRQADTKYRPQVFDTRTGILFEIGWFLLLVLSALLLFFAFEEHGVIAAIVAVVVFWVLLPLWFVPVVRRRILPPWDAVKEELEGQGYTEDNYMSGDWWKKKKGQKKDTRIETRMEARREARRKAREEAKKVAREETTEEKKAQETGSDETG